MDSSTPTGGIDRGERPGDGRSAGLEDWIFESLALALKAARERGPVVPTGAEDLQIHAIDRGDFRGNLGTPDDGGERLSTAPSAQETSGHSRLAWGAQAEELLLRSESRQWSAAVAQQATLQAEASPLPVGGGEPAVSAAAPTQGAGETLAAPLARAEVRDAQVGSALGWAGRDTGPRAER